MKSAGKCFFVAPHLLHEHSGLDADPSPFVPASRVGNPEFRLDDASGTKRTAAAIGLRAPARD